MDERPSIPYTPPGPAEMRRALLGRFIRLEEELARPEVQAEMEEALEEARAAARLIREKHGATRVRLFGSLARRDRARGYDIDLAVEGLAPGARMAAWSDAERLCTRELDLIELERAPALLRARVDEDGVDLP